MSLRKRLLGFLTPPHDAPVEAPGPVVSARRPDPRLIASAVYKANPPEPPSATDYARVLSYWNQQCADDPDLTWSTFISDLNRRRRFYAAERREREAELVKLQSRIKPLP